MHGAWAAQNMACCQMFTNECKKKTQKHHTAKQELKNPQRQRCGASWQQFVIKQENQSAGAYLTKFVIARISGSFL